jgi:hypothetical protein
MLGQPQREQADVGARCGRKGPRSVSFLTEGLDKSI